MLAAHVVVVSRECTSPACARIGSSPKHCSKSPARAHISSASVDAPPAPPAPVCSALAAVRRLPASCAGCRSCKCQPPRRLPVPASGVGPETLVAGETAAAAAGERAACLSRWRRDRGCHRCPSCSVCTSVTRCRDCVELVPGSVLGTDSSCESAATANHPTPRQPKSAAGPAATVLAADGAVGENTIAVRLAASTAVILLSPHACCCDTHVFVSMEQTRLNCRRKGGKTNASKHCSNSCGCCCRDLDTYVRLLQNRLQRRSNHHRRQRIQLCLG